MSRRHAVVVAGAAVLILLAWFMLLWSPAGADLAGARERRAAAEDQVRQLQARLVKLQAARHDGPSLQAAAMKVRGAVPDTADIAGLVLAVNQAAAEAKVEFSSINPSPVMTSAVGGPNEVPLALTVKGTYGQVLGFLDRLLDLPRIVVLDTVGVTSSQIDGRIELTVTMTGRAYTAEAVTPPAAAATTPPAAPAAPVTPDPSAQATSTPTSTPTMVP